MVTIYTAQHNLHDTDGIRMDGHPSVIDEVPARAEILVGAVRAAD